MLGNNTNTNTDVQKKPRYRRGSLKPEQVLSRFIKDNPDATAAELRQIARDYLAERAEFEDQSSWDFNFWLIEKALLREIKPPPPDFRPAVKQQREALRQQLDKTMAQNHEKLIETEVKIRLLEYQTTYGKTLGDCTGAECKRLGVRYGGFFAELGKRLTRSETVRAHLSEGELQAIAKTHRMIGDKALR